MSSQTGDRCAIYKRIDGLDEARTIGDLVARLKPILNELAYYAVTGEAAVMETREEWHTAFTDRLYEAVGADRQAALAQAGLPPNSMATSIRRPPPAPSIHPAPDPGRVARRGGRAAEPRNPQQQQQQLGLEPRDGFSDSRERLPLPPPANRPRANDVPPSLRAIMDGTHPSFREDDS